MTFKTKDNKELNRNHLNSTNNLGMSLPLRAQTSFHWYTQVEHIIHFSPFFVFWKRLLLYGHCALSSLSFVTRRHAERLLLLLLLLSSSSSSFLMSSSLSSL